MIDFSAYLTFFTTKNRVCWTFLWRQIYTHIRIHKLTTPSVFLPLEAGLHFLLTLFLWILEFCFVVLVWRTCESLGTGKFLKSYPQGILLSILFCPFLCELTKARTPLIRPAPKNAETKTPLLPLKPVHLGVISNMALVLKDVEHAEEAGYDGVVADAREVRERIAERRGGVL